MAPSVLGVGIPASSKFVPEDRREGLQKVLEFMESDMQASPYDWEFYDVDPDMDFGLVMKKLHERKWDVVMVGVGLRTAPPLTGFFEKIVNAVAVELPGTRIAFNNSIPETQAACKRALELKFD